MMLHLRPTSLTPWKLTHQLIDLQVERLSSSVGPFAPGTSLLIVDEVQSGFGRTGSYFVIKEKKPDILVMAKVAFSDLFHFPVLV